MFRPWVLVSLIIGIPVLIYAVSATNYIVRCSPARNSCYEHRQAGCSIDGEYNIQVGSVQSEATCDMKTEGGGWTLVANYLHRKGQPGGPSNLERGKFPLQDHVALGLDEYGTRAWGHASNATLSTLPFKEMRFRCLTSAHQRNVDFTIGPGKCQEYIKGGKGACVQSAADGAELAANSRGMANNQARIPGITDKGWKDQGDNAITNYPFYIDYRNHWSIGALPGRFECDDYEGGGTTSTFHQVWVR